MCFEHHACHITHLFVKMESLVHPECHLKNFHQCRLVTEADGLTSPYWNQWSMGFDGWIFQWESTAPSSSKMALSVYCIPLCMLMPVTTLFCHLYPRPQSVPTKRYLHCRTLQPMASGQRLLCVSRVEESNPLKATVGSGGLFQWLKNAKRTNNCLHGKPSSLKKIIW